MTPPMRRRNRFCTGFALTVAALALPGACTRIPALDQSVPEALRHAGYPALIPLDGVVAAADPPAAQAAEIERDLAARRDRLQRRARQLQAGAPTTAPADPRDEDETDG